MRVDLIGKATKDIPYIIRTSVEPLEAPHGYRLQESKFKKLIEFEKKVASFMEWVRSTASPLTVVHESYIIGSMRAIDFHIEGIAEGEIERVKNLFK